LLSVLIVVYTLIDAALNTALGLSVMLVDRASAFTASAFLLLRGITVIYSLWLFVSVIQRMFDTSGFTYFSHGLLGLAVYAVVTLIVLWAAQQNAVRYAHVSA
jgi:flagellar biosynthesis protein FlhB